MPPRPRRGLGQGLDALVPDVASLADPDLDLASPAPTGPMPGAADASALAVARWEYACLERPSRKRRKKAKRRYARIWFSAPGTAALARPRPTVLAARSWWGALGLLGDEGWELAGVDGRVLYFKRRVA